MKSGAPVLEEESDIEVGEQSGLAMLKTLEVFQRQNPENPVYLFLLAKGYTSYGFGFLENRMLQYQYKDPARYDVYLERAKLFYSRGKSFGLRLIEKRDKGLREAIDQGLEPLRKRLAGAGQGEVEALFWTALSWGNYVNLTKDSVRSVSDLAIVEAIMGRVLELNPNYFYGGPHLFYGAYYSSRPAMLGGNVTKGKEHFEAAAKATGRRFLMTYVLEAQYLAVQEQDKSLYGELLSKVEDGKAELLPEQRLANELAKERAKFLRDSEKKLF